MLLYSTVIFAMEGIGVVMPVENDMKQPQHFLGCPGVLNTGKGEKQIKFLHTIIMKLTKCVNHFFSDVYRSCFIQYYWILWLCALR